MSEYWKSTPKYWCKFCAVYVRDTKLERTNHESTAKHQSAVKRSLKDLHRSADQAEKEKERARREVERLNGVVSAQGSSSKTATTKQDGQGTAQISQSERQRQLEQLAGLGVAIPTELRGDIAMAGEWSVTSVRVIDGGDGDGNAGEPIKEEETVLVRRAVGVKRAREMTEDEKEREEALNGLFDQNKRRKWGVGSRTMPDGEDEELDALLSGGLAVKKKEEDDVEVKKEEEETRKEPALDAVPDVKTEISQAIKVDGKEAGLIDIPAKKGSEAQAVIFKKRKPKNIRQK